MTRRSAVLLSLGVSTTPSVLSFDEKPKGKIKSKKARPKSEGDELVQWKPNPAFPGSPILFRSKTFSGAATWLDQKIEFRRDGDEFTALAGVNLNRSPGRYSLVLDARTIEIRVATHPYPSSTITVPQKFVEPPKVIQQRIADESLVKRTVFKSSPPERLWGGPFVAPTNTRYTSSFGARRVYNGKTRSVHQGLDFSVAIGTQIKAANSGRVVIARDFYFEGGFIVIDHGESIFTLYMHLSQFQVKEGDAVDKGAPIARSGSSGRVTGPHLHFGIQWRGAYLEPSTLLRLWRA
jgi:murein DD-endopeptidase MepM/ murein hydrolase activator NlpD